MKELEFLGNSLENIQLFSYSAKQRTGYELHKVQSGLEPDNWKPMTSVGSGVKEIRVAASDGIYRTVYIAKFKETVYVLHAFQKKDQKTRQEDVDLAKKRLKEIGGK